MTIKCTKFDSSQKLDVKLKLSSFNELNNMSYVIINWQIFYLSQTTLLARKTLPIKPNGKFVKH